MDYSSKIFIGRQPILDRDRRTFAYELLYRSGMENIFPGGSASQATIKLLEGSFCTLGIDRITGSRRAFINFSRSLLLSDLSFLSPERVVIEVLETVMVDQDLVEVISGLKRKGFYIALDDFTWTPEFEPLIALADFIKVDWLATPQGEIERIARAFADSSIKLVAEKIENYDQFKVAHVLGFDYFQGFFFARPSILKGRDVRPARRTRLRLLAAVNSSEMRIEQIYSLLMKDPALAIKVLRLVNSANFGLPEKISSIRQAVTLLGERRLKQWLSIIFLSSISRGAPEALFNAAVVRACFSERVAMEVGQSEIGASAFMAGLLSLTEALFNIPACEVLRDLPLHADIKNAVISKKGPLFPFVALSQACELADMRKIAGLCRDLGLSTSRVVECWMESVRWANDSMSVLSNP